MTKYLLHQADLARLTVEARGKGVAQGMWWALLDYFRTSPAEFQAVDPEVLA